MSVNVSGHRSGVNPGVSNNSLTHYFLHSIPKGAWYRGPLTFVRVFVNLLVHWYYLITEPCGTYYRIHAPMSAASLYPSDAEAVSLTGQYSVGPYHIQGTVLEQRS